MKRFKRLIYTLVLSLSLTMLTPISIANIPINAAITVQAKSTTVYITKTGKKYHCKKCGKGKYIKTTLKNAKAKGLKPCKKCYGK